MPVWWPNDVFEWTALKNLSHRWAYHTIPLLYHTVPYHSIPCHTVKYHTIPYHTVPYSTIPYHTRYDGQLGDSYSNCLRLAIVQGYEHYGKVSHAAPAPTSPAASPKTTQTTRNLTHNLALNLTHTATT